MSETWTGYTTFDLLQEKPKPTTTGGTVLQDRDVNDELPHREQKDTKTTTSKEEDAPLLPPPGLEHHLPRQTDYWKQDGHTWTRYHKLPRR